MLRFPLEKLLQEKDFEGFEGISSKGAFSRETLQEGLVASQAQRTHPLLHDSIQDEAQLGVVAGLVGCKVCHQLVAAVWSKGRQEIHSGLGVPSPSKINRQLWHTCEKQVSTDLLREWAILLMGSPLAAVSGGEEGWAYVFKAREAVEAPSDFEQRAVRRSCTDIQEGQETGDVHFATELAQKLAEYEKAWAAARAEAGLGPVRRPTVLEHLGTPDGKSCKDLHKQCAWWADKGECSANWRYMVGSEDQTALKGFCRLSCGACSPAAASGLPEEADARLEEASAALLAGIDAQLCAERQPCSGLSGDAHRAMDTAKTTGGAVSPDGGPGADVIAASRNMVRAQMRRSDNPLTGLDGPLQPGSEEELLPGGVGADALAEVAGWCYYVSQGWWSFELCPGHHVGQYHIEDAQRIDSVLSLGRYDADQDGKDGVGEGSYPALPAADMLPGLAVSVPYIATLYSGGASCDGSDASPKRASKVQLACSPDADVYMLVREPETCRYVVTLYHPSLCAVEGYQHSKIEPRELITSAIKALVARREEL